MSHELMLASLQLLGSAVAMDGQEITTVLAGDTKALSDFKSSINGLVAALWRGAITEFEFVNSMDFSLQLHLNEAWLRGASQCGIKEEDLSSAEIAARSDFINGQLPFAIGFAQSIVRASREEGALLRTHAPRADMWINAYNEALNVSQQMACANQKLRWRWDPLKEHCVDCGNLNGQVRRASFWQQVGIAPQSRQLACQGFRCGCRFEVTDAALSRGRLPGFSRSI